MLLWFLLYEKNSRMLLYLMAILMAHFLKIFWSSKIDFFVKITFRASLIRTAALNSLATLIIISHKIMRLFKSNTTISYYFVNYEWQIHGPLWYFITYLINQSDTYKIFKCEQISCAQLVVTVKTQIKIFPIHKFNEERKHWICLHFFKYV